jgi:hypothetical protein
VVWWRLPVVALLLFCLASCWRDPQIVYVDKVVRHEHTLSPVCLRMPAWPPISKVCDSDYMPLIDAWIGHAAACLGVGTYELEYIVEFPQCPR